MKLTNGIKAYCQTLRNICNFYNNFSDKTIIEMVLINKIETEIKNGNTK